MLVVLSEQIIVSVDHSVSEFEGMIQWIEVAVTGMNVCGAWNIGREHSSPVAWSFSVYKAVIHNTWFVRGWNGSFFCRTVHLNADKPCTVDL